MCRIGLFIEDQAHETFIKALLKRFEAEYGVPFELIQRSSLRGGDRITNELRQYISDLKKDKERIPHLLIIARDGNCKSYQERKNEMEKLVGLSLKCLVVYAIPDPHIERWLLLDSRAFKKAVGVGCKAPDLKCDPELGSSACRISSPKRRFRF